jgi:hypothetical protein
MLRSARGSRPALTLRSVAKQRVSKGEGGHLTMMVRVSKHEAASSFETALRASSG